MNNGFDKIIGLLQDFGLYVGIAIALWGLLEYMWDNPGGKQRVLKAIMCYVGLFVIPMIFYTIHDSFKPNQSPAAVEQKIINPQQNR